MFVLHVAVIGNNLFCKYRKSSVKSRGQLVVDLYALASSRINLVFMMFERIVASH